MSKLRPTVNSNDHFQGNENAPIVLVEYGDYECPYCVRAYPIIKNIQLALGSNLKFVFRNFPLAEVHSNATKAAIVAEAASAQGKFWQMHDILFENQHHLGDVSLIKYAAEVGVNIDQLETDIENPQYAQKVESDFESGARSGVWGTPTFYINDEEYDGLWEEEYFLEYLQGLIV
jgi:protein-disulfide isomerase